MRETPSNPDAFISREITARNNKRVLNAKGQDVTRVPDMAELRELLKDDNPHVGAVFFTTSCDTPYHRCRIFFNSRRDKYILQYVLWEEHVCKLSIAYPTATRAWQAFISKPRRVIWRKTIQF